MSDSSRTPTLTPSRSPSPPPIVQPDHFYGSENAQVLPSPNSDGKTWLDPADDPLAHRGIPVFKPTMHDFDDFEGYMTKVECWGMRSGIIKVIPPKEWTDSLPSIKPQLRDVQIKRPIEQHMLGNGGLFRQENMEKRKLMTVREWVELTRKDGYRTPGLEDVGLHKRSANVVKPKTRRGKKKEADAVKADSAGPVVIKEELIDDYHQLANGIGSTSSLVSPPSTDEASASPTVPFESTPSGIADDEEEEKPKGKAKAKLAGKRQSRPTRAVKLAQNIGIDRAFVDKFDPQEDWLPSGTKASDYTPEFCRELERQYWRNCSLGKPAWYGADTQGSLYTDETTVWNVAHLPSTLTRILPASSEGLPGVNTPYLYFGMWRATFAWHVEDMDLFSINYIHFGAPKFWYAIPQGRAGALEQTMRGYFPNDTSQCPQFLRHKSFLASPTLLAQSSCRPNHLVQHAGEFVITFPRGYHAGFNLGLNCAESVNFALDSWLELGRRAKACECISDSVRIDVDKLLEDRARERGELPPIQYSPVRTLSKTPTKGKKVRKEVKAEIVDHVLPLLKISRKRKSEPNDESAPKLKKIKIKASTSNATSSQPTPKPVHKLTVTLKLGPRPTEPEGYPCCLCISTSRDGLLKVHDPPLERKDAVEAAGNPKIWMAHESCASIVPETWVDEIDTQIGKERVVFGVDGIVKDRWNLKCSACTKVRLKSHGAPVQCTKGKCPKAFHVSCAKDGSAQGLVFEVVREVAKEVVLLDSIAPAVDPAQANVDQMQVDFTTPPFDLDSMAIGNPAEGVTASASAEPASRVLKIIKKLEVQILCTQHNPAIAAAKKANKQDKIKNDLMSLPAMSRIKIHVSAGVFEVSLVRVIEETTSVEVLWDRGVKREFKWGSVVFGSTDGPVLQKPSEPAPEPERPASVMPVTTYPSVTAATANATCPIAPQPVASSSYGQSTSQQRPAQNESVVKPYANTSYSSTYPRQNTYDYWSYANQAAQYGPAQTAPYPYYSAYFPQVVAVPGTAQQQYHPYAYAQAYTQAQIAYSQGQAGHSQGQYRNGQLHWQQPYQGPSQSSSSPTHHQGGSSSYLVASTSVNSAPSRQSQSATPRPPSAPSSATPSAQEKLADPQLCDGTSSTRPPSVTSTLSEQPITQYLATPIPISIVSTPTASMPQQAGPSPTIMGPGVPSDRELAALTALMQHPERVNELLQNPQLRDAVKYAADQSSRVGS